MADGARTAGLRRRRSPRSADGSTPAGVNTVPGASLAKPPALILGTILLAAGLYFLHGQHGFTKLSNFPGGSAHTTGNSFFGIFGINGWTGMGTAIAGGLLLFGAAQHHLAKVMSLVVGIVLAAAAIIALVNHGNVLGLAAANGWTEIGWGAVAVFLLLNTLAPRRRREIPAGETGRPAYGDHAVHGRREPAAELPVADREATRNERMDPDREVTRNERTVTNREATRNEPVGDRPDVTPQDIVEGRRTRRDVVGRGSDPVEPGTRVR